MKHILGNNRYMLKIIWDIDKKFYLYACLKIIINAIESVLAVLIARYILVALSEKVGIDTIMMLCGVLLGVRLVNSRISCWFNLKISGRLGLCVQGKFQSMIMEKTKSIDQACYDDTEFYNTYIMALYEVDGRAMKVFYSFMNLLSCVFSLVAVLSIMLYLDPVLIWISLIGLVVDFLIFSVRIKLYYKYDKERMVVDRKREYVKRIFYVHDYSKELKLFPIRNNLIRRYEQETDLQMQIQKKWFGKLTELDVLADSLSMVVSTIITFYLAYNVLTGQISVADYVTLQSTTVMLGNNLRGISNVLNTMKENSLYIDNFKKFIDYDAKIEKEEDEGQLLAAGKEPFQLELRDVCFRYGASSAFAINNLSFSIKSGEKIAIVGYNGAGKTTLMKLLLRLYDVTSGQILINGVPIEELNLREYRKQIGVVFQDFKTYALTILENMVDLEEKDKREGQIKEALKKSKMEQKIQSFPSDINTFLTKEFDEQGENLSGGEWQKLAIARAFVEKYRMLILDEPSSALDPIAENEIIQSIMELSSDNTVLLITHRLSTLKLADRIIYMEGGEMVEMGTHEELMEKNGKYATLYKTQVNNYIICD